MLNLHIFLVLLTVNNIVSQEVVVSQVTRTETVIVKTRSSSPNEENKLINIEKTGVPQTISSSNKKLIKPSIEKDNNFTLLSPSIQLENTNIDPQALRNMSEKSNQNNTSELPPSEVNSSSNDNEDKIKVKPLDIFPVNSNGLANSTIEFKPSTNKTVIQSVGKASDLEGATENKFNNVTVQSKSAFDGGQCPTGYVKVNGQCVLPD